MTTATTRKLPGYFWDKGGHVFHSMHPDYGAAGNGTTNDQTALAALLSDANGSGGTVLINAQHKITSPLSLSGLTDVTIEFGPRGKIIPAVGSGFALSGSVLTRVGIMRPRIIGTGGSTFSVGMAFDGMLDCWIKGGEVSGGNVSSGTGLERCGGLWVGNSNNVLVKRLYSHGHAATTITHTGGTDTFGDVLGADIQFGEDGSVCTEIHVIECRAHSATRCNIILFDTDDYLIQGNYTNGAKYRTIGLSGGYGVTVYRTNGNPTRCRRGRVLGNNIRNTEGTGLYLQSIVDCVVDENNFEDVARLQPDATLVVAAIGVSESVGVAIGGANRVKNSGKDGICISSTTGDVQTTIGPVSIEDCEAFGIDLRGPLSSITVNGPTIKDTLVGIGSRDPISTILGNTNATAGSASTVTAATAWTVNAYTDQIVTIVSGTGAGISRRIASNTATILTISGTWGTNPDATSVFKIVSAPRRGMVINGPVVRNTKVGSVGVKFENCVDCVLNGGSMQETGGEGVYADNTNSGLIVRGVDVVDAGVFAPGSPYFGVTILAPGSTVEGCHSNNGKLRTQYGGFSLSGAGTRLINSDSTDVNTQRYAYASGAVGIGSIDNTANTRTGYAMTGPLVLPVVTVTYATTMTPDATAGEVFTITANNGTGFTIATPTGGTTGQFITITVKNTSGGALGAVAFGGGYKLSAWVSPATGQSRSITFQLKNGAWEEISRTPNDVPN